VKTPNRLKDNLLRITKLIGSNNLLHNSFEIGILIKGIDGVLEVIGGFLLILVYPERLNRIFVFLTQHELSEDPDDVIANFLLKTSHEFSVGSQYFGVLYLLTHGIVKLFLFAMLRQRKLWAYPLTIVFLILFIGYQCYRYTYSKSIWLIVLTVFDVIMVFLTWLEYKRIKKTT
jgi:uncharacterized membrane protein